jgi:hypothetical protein
VAGGRLPAAHLDVFGQHKKREMAHSCRHSDELPGSGKGRMTAESYTTKKGICRNPARFNEAAVIQRTQYIT